MSSDEQIAAAIKGIETDIGWIKNSISDADNKYAKKYTERVVWLMVSGALLWLMAQLFNVINSASAFFT